MFWLNMDPRQLPRSGENNLWYHFAGSDTVVVFVHGVLSDSRSCWLHEDTRATTPSQYWPDLVISDPRLGNPSIYLGGYYTAIDAGPYDIRNCADELNDALNRPDAASRQTVLAHRRILFVCHSTGGIVVRYLLDKHYARFQEKDIGLVLIASPSYGSGLADKLDLLARLYKNKLGRALQWGSWSLQDLDTRFKDLVHQKRIPNLSGVEAYENHFILHRKWWPARKIVVDELSAGRYFGAPRLLRQTDHFSAVKPDSLRHPAHELLVDFVTTQYQPGKSALTTEVPRAPRSSAVKPRATSLPVQEESSETLQALEGAYRDFETIHRGHYSVVRRCVNRSTGEICIVKRTEAEMVSLAAIKVLQEARIPGVVVPSRVWERNGFVWEELPYVNGTLLRDAVPKGIGGLRGSMLAACHDSLMEILAKLRNAGLIYRDIHPDNIFLVVKPITPDKTSLWHRFANRRREYFLLDVQSGDAEAQSDAEAMAAATPFTSDWLLTDSSSVVLADEASTRVSITHGSTTPEEQTFGKPVYASDVYALGASLYYSITGHEVPGASQPKREDEMWRKLGDIAEHIHPSVDFESHLMRMLSRSPDDRPGPDYELTNNTISPSFCGALLLADGRGIIANTEGLWNCLTDQHRLQRFCQRSSSRYWKELADYVNAALASEP